MPTDWEKYSDTQFNVLFVLVPGDLEQGLKFRFTTNGDSGWILFEQIRLSDPFLSKWYSEIFEICHGRIIHTLIKSKDIDCAISQFITAISSEDGFFSTLVH